MCLPCGNAPHDGKLGNGCGRTLSRWGRSSATEPDAPAPFYSQFCKQFPIRIAAPGAARLGEEMAVALNSPLRDPLVTRPDLESLAKRTVLGSLTAFLSQVAK